MPTKSQFRRVAEGKSVGKERHESSTGYARKKGERDDEFGPLLVERRPYTSKKGIYHSLDSAEMSILNYMRAKHPLIQKESFEHLVEYYLLRYSPARHAANKQVSFKYEIRYGADPGDRGFFPASEDVFVRDFGLMYVRPIGFKKWSHRKLNEYMLEVRDFAKTRNGKVIFGPGAVKRAESAREHCGMVEDHTFFRLDTVKKVRTGGVPFDQIRADSGWKHAAKLRFDAIATNPEWSKWYSELIACGTLVGYKPHYGVGYAIKRYFVNRVQMFLVLYALPFNEYRRFAHYLLVDDKELKRKLKDVLREMEGRHCDSVRHIAIECPKEMLDELFAGEDLDDKIEHWDDVTPTKVGGDHPVSSDLNGCHGSYTNTDDHKSFGAYANLVFTMYFALGAMYVLSGRCIHRFLTYFSIEVPADGEQAEKFLTYRFMQVSFFFLIAAFSKLGAVVVILLPVFVANLPYKLTSWSKADIAIYIASLYFHLCACSIVLFLVLYNYVGFFQFLWALWDLFTTSIYAVNVAVVLGILRYVPGADKYIFMCTSGFLVFYLNPFHTATGPEYSSDVAGDGPSHGGGKVYHGRSRGNPDPPRAPNINSALAIATGAIGGGGSTSSGSTSSSGSRRNRGPPVKTAGGGTGSPAPAAMGGGGGAPPPPQVPQAPPAQQQQDSDDEEEDREPAETTVRVLFGTKNSKLSTSLASKCASVVWSFFTHLYILVFLAWTEIDIRSDDLFRFWTAAPSVCAIDDVLATQRGGLTDANGDYTEVVVKFTELKYDFLGLRWIPLYEHSDPFASIRNLIGFDPIPAFAGPSVVALVAGMQDVLSDNIRRCGAFSTMIDPRTLTSVIAETNFTHCCVQTVYPEVMRALLVRFSGVSKNSHAVNLQSFRSFAFTTYKEDIDGGRYDIPILMSSILCAHQTSYFTTLMCEAYVDPSLTDKSIVYGGVRSIAVPHFQ